MSIEKSFAQLRGSVAQTNAQTVGISPAMAMGSVYMTAAHATGLMFHNSVNAQNQQNIVGQTALVQGITQIYDMSNISNTVSMVKLLNNS